MSQSDKILEAMQHGDRITPLDALTRFNCMRLAARISDLKHKGYAICMRTVKDGEKSYAEYWMETEAQGSLAFTTPIKPQMGEV